MRIIFDKTLYISLFVTLLISCSTNRILKLDNLPKIDLTNVSGLYEWNMRDHFVKIKLFDDKLFSYEFSNSFEKGHYKGSYTLNDNLLTLMSDSLVSQEWINVINEQEDKIKCVAEHSRFEFMMTKEGLHKKNEEGNFQREVTYIKKLNSW